jgi:hypothetical protein
MRMLPASVITMRCFDQERRKGVHKCAAQSGYTGDGCSARHQ